MASGTVDSGNVSVKSVLAEVFVISGDADVVGKAIDEVGVVDVADVVVAANVDNESVVADKSSIVDDINEDETFRDVVISLAETPATNNTYLIYSQLLVLSLILCVDSALHNCHSTAIRSRLVLD